MERLTGVIFGGYPRISEDPKDLRTGFDRQVEDIRSEVSRRGGDPDEIVWFPENNTSAYKKKRIKVVDPMGNEYIGYRVIRPKWHAALHALRNREINVLVAWDLDRIARDSRDIEDAIEVVEHYDGTILSATASEMNLATESGQMMAKMFVIMAHKSSSDTGRRVARAHLSTAKVGKPVGGFRPFGWKPDKATLEPAEAALVRKAATEVIAGASLRSIVREWNAAGVPTTVGNVWKLPTLRQYLRSPRLVGHRVHQGKVLLDDKGDPVLGQWEQMLDQETYDRLQLVLARPETRARVPRRNARHYLLTGTVRCGICNAPMYGNRYGSHEGQERYYYVCHEEGHNVSVSGHGTDALIRDLVIARLANEDVGEGPVPVWSGAHELDEVDRKIKELMSAFDAGTLSGDLVFPRVQALQEKQAVMREDRDQWLLETTGPATHPITREEWDGMSMDLRRGHVEKLFTAVLIRPAKQRQNRLDPERLVPVPREHDREGRPSLSVVQG